MNSQPKICGQSITITINLCLHNKPTEITILGNNGPTRHDQCEHEPCPVSTLSIVLVTLHHSWFGSPLMQDVMGVGFAVLGAAFLAVTGGEAMYADMGHFGRSQRNHHRKSEPNAARHGVGLSHAVSNLS
jgi:K+ potassium transporter